ARYQQVGLAASHSFRSVGKWFVVQITTVGKGPLRKFDCIDSGWVQIIFVEALPVTAVGSAILIVCIRQITFQNRVGVAQAHGLKSRGKCRSATGGIGEERIVFRLEVVS